MAGETLFRVGEPGDGCYRLDRGILKVNIISPGGDERILAILGSPSIVGELAIIDGRPRSASVVAVRDCDLSFINRTVFNQYSSQHPELYRYLVDVLVSRLRETNQTIAAMSFLSIKARVARTLLELAKHLGESESTGHVLIRHKLNQGDIAAMAGVVGRHCWQSLERTSSARKSSFSTIMRNGHANQYARLSSFAARLAPELVRSSDR